MIGLTLILIAVTLYIIVKYEFGSPMTSYNVFDAFFQSLGIHLGALIYFYRKRQVYRLFIFTVSYYTMIIIALYQSSLITHLTTRGSENQYGSIEEVMDNGLPGHFFYASVVLFNITDHDLWNRVLAPGKYVLTDHAYNILRHIANNKTIYSFLNYNFANYVIHRELLDERHKPRVRTLPGYYSKFLVGMFTSKGHPLRDVIRDNILRLTEAGILDLWMEQILDGVTEVGGGDGFSGDDGPKALTVEHLRGAFYIVPLMLSVAGVVFICEIVYYWWTTRKFKTMIMLKYTGRNRQELQCDDTIGKSGNYQKNLYRWTKCQALRK